MGICFPSILLADICAQVGDSRKNITGGGGGEEGVKVEQNSKPKKIPILDQIGTLKNTYI